MTPKFSAEYEFGSTTKTTLPGDEFGYIGKGLGPNTGPWGVISVLGQK